MNAPIHSDWMKTNHMALSSELNWLRHRLQNALHGGANGLSDAPEETAPALDFLCEQLQLSRFERAVLLLCAGVVLEAEFARLCAADENDCGCDYPTFGLALAVLPESHWSGLSPQAPLRYWQLIHVCDPSRLTTSRIYIDDSILHYLLGIPVFDPRLAGIVRVLSAPERLPASQLQQAEHVGRVWKEARGPLPVISLRGTDGSGARDVASRACAGLGLRPLGVRADDIPPGGEERDLLARLLTRECALGRSALIIEVADSGSAQLASFLDRLACPVIVHGDGPATPGRHTTALEIHKPLAAEQTALWRAALEDAGGVDEAALQSIVAHFDFSAQDIFATAEQACLAARGVKISFPTLWQSCRARARGGLEHLAERLISQATWNDLVLPPAQLTLLKDIAQQARHRATVYEIWGFAARGERGLGISALFAGESGTGKTLAAEVIAGELELDLYRIDLSAVVSKYIGETEKNLERLFAAAESSGAVLLFDEADALFGKRSEVKDSHDRYANIELAYLLQRMESYRGLSILTTNMKSALDAAFMRRIRFVVPFPFPDAAQRTEIWRRIFPEALPRAELNLEQLGRLHVAGGNIRNIALNAAFLAAGNGRLLSMSHLARATRMEFAKFERPLNEAEIRGWQ